MIEIPIHPLYHKNLQKNRGEGMPCPICGSLVRPENYKYWLHVGQGGGYFVTEEECPESDPGCMGIFPVGPTCWKKHPEIHPYRAMKNPAET